MTVKRWIPLFIVLVVAAVVAIWQIRVYTGSRRCDWPSCRPRPNGCGDSVAELTRADATPAGAPAPAPAVESPERAA